jgi:serine/threonine-protein kinase
MSLGAPDAQPTMLEPGMRLDRYELLCVLAHGGMANVWLARAQGKMGFAKLFAIKTILPGVAEEQSFKDMFLDEARIASRIEHPNVVHILDVGEALGVPYLVMDLVEGEPLYKLPRACEKMGLKMPLGVCLRILADACHGLHAAHELRDDAGVLLGVVHRDMSPQNILVSSAGVSKVIDFGVAKARDRATAQTSAGTLKGKINYMPREQARGQEVDRRADTWSLGAVLYYLLVGRPPYKEDTQLATLQLAMNAAPIPPLPVTIPMSLRATVTRALAHEPAQRFQTAADMGDALETLMRKLHVVTTHSEVGAFVHKVLGEKLDARKQLITSAMAEASYRERVREALTVPIEIDTSDDDGASLQQGIVAMPSIVSSMPPPIGSQPRALDEISQRREGSTVDTFVTRPMPPPAGRWPIVVAAVMGVLAIVGAMLLGYSLKGRSITATAAAATAAPVPAPPVSQLRAAPTAVDAPPPAAEPGMSTTNANVNATATSSTPAGTVARWAPPAGGAAPAPTKKAKKRDDEAGF